MGRSIARLIAPLTFALMLSGCAMALRSPSVAELKFNPGRYQNKGTFTKLRPGHCIGADSKKFLQGWMDHHVAWVKKHAG